MEALGREIERIAGDPAIVLRLRQSFPMRPEHAGRRVCDGEAVLAAALTAPGTLPAGISPAQLAPLQSAIDTYGDLLVADAVFDLVDGRLEHAAEAMEAAAGLGAPPEFRVLSTRRRGSSVTTTVLGALPVAAPPTTAGPCGVADPILWQLLQITLDGAATWTWRVDTGAGTTTVTLADLGWDPIDAATAPPGSLEAMVRVAAGAAASAPISGGTGGDKVAAAGRLIALLGGGFPDRAIAATAVAGAVSGLQSRLTALRAGATDLRTRLAAAGAPPIAETARWHIALDAAAGTSERAAAAAAELADRLAATQPPAVSVDALQAQLRHLSGAAGLPIVAAVAPAALQGKPPAKLTAAAVAAGGDAAFFHAWLEPLAAVRAPLARLEAHLLRGAGWVAWSDQPGAPWAPDDHLVVVGPAGTLAGATVGVVVIDRWAQTIPAPKHTTTAAFGFTAPRSRAPQAILVAVPPDVSVPLDTKTLVAIAAQARTLARARMATAATAAPFRVGLPTSLLLTAGPSGVVLEDLTA
jgi:hypothetical protein